MRTLSLLLVGVVVGWAASGLDWTREAVGQESAPPTAGAERSIRRGETAAPTPGTDAPPYDPNANAEPKPYVPPGFDAQPGPALELEELGEPIAESTRGAVPSPDLLGRYQVSAYGSPSGHGCYIVDTMTGRTWHINNGQPPQVVGEELGPQATQQSMPVPATTDNSPALLIAPTQSMIVPQPSTNEPTPDAAD
jgi:hypothetical protein